MIIDITKDNEVPLHNKSKNGLTNKLGNSTKFPFNTRRMVYNCDKHCTEISKIKYCFDFIPNCHNWNIKNRKIYEFL